MIKKVLMLFITVLLITLSLSGCGKKEKNPNDAIDYLKSLNSYTCDVSVHIKNSMQEIETQCKQFYRKDYGHRLDIDKDRILLYKKNDIIVSDLNNNMKYTLDKEFDSVYKLSFIEEYIGLLYTDEDIESSFKEIEGREYQLIQLNIPGNNRNICKAVMYVNLEDNCPDKIVIYDIKGNEVLNFIYKNFVPNAEVSEETFQ
ncbi:germination lipoprotein GerS-related protein [Clostridium sp.]|jgi:outer membrane lipoprotein-sorting protein|uniref:germination lipoprotein GerS-related protein n=1 Tax=Clostridium sp. TaxID=1506 RepID=UPI0039F48688